MSCLLALAAAGGRQAAAQVAQPSAPAATETPIAPGALTSGGSPLLTFGEDPNRQLVINGFGVLGYDYDFNTGKNSFADSALALSLYEGLSDHLTVFAQLTTSRNAPSPFLADAGATNDVATDIDNLQLRWQPSLSSGFSITAGKFDSPMAIERDDAPLNFQATSSFTFDFARPVKFTGLAAYQAISPQLEVWGIVANGWDDDVDNNHGKTGGLYGLWSPSLAAHVGLGVLHGPEKDHQENDNRSAVIGTLLLQPAAGWVVGAESVYGQEPHSAVDGGTAKWYGEMLFTHLRFDRHWAATLRIDYFDDVGGSRTGTRQVLREITLSPQYLVGGGFYGIFRYLEHTSLRLPELALRLDLRRDRSSAPVFASRQDGVGRRDNTQATLQTVFLF
ncbi:MAG TPA: outer membrane beta-barrel protein [Thermoanaerobaculia bacterium]|nr:outer membrane beta-barrel protein [Thermoanaerobaculia bacterium]